MTTTKTKTELDDLLKNPFGESSFVNTPSIADKTEDIPLDTTNDNEPKAYNALSPELQAKADKLASQLDINNSQGVLEYGSGAQQQLGSFSESLLKKVSVQETGEVGEVLADLMYKLNETDPKDLVAEDKNIFRKLFGKVKRSIADMSIRYQEVGAQLDNIAKKLDSEKNVLIKDNNMLEELYVQNKTYFDVLNVFIAAAEIKIDEILTEVLPEAVNVAETSGNQMDVQKVNDINHFLDRLEKRTHDLKLARQIAIQQAPQIRLIQNTNQALAEKIQSSINTSIPLWKNQVVISLTLLRQKDAATAQRQVSQTTNDLLARNSEMLKISTIETAKENERGVIDIDTLQKTQTDLVDTLQETLQIQRDGRIKRKEAQKELIAMESTLKQSLLETIQEAK